MTEQKYDVNTVMEDPRVNKKTTEGRWGSRVPFKVRDSINSDLRDYDDMVEKGKFRVNCKFYKPVSITQGHSFHHYCPEWNIRVVEEDTEKETTLHYTGKHFYIENGKYLNEDWDEYLRKKKDNERSWWLAN